MENKKELFALIIAALFLIHFITPLIYVNPDDAYQICLALNNKIDFHRILYVFVVKIGLIIGNLDLWIRAIHSIVAALAFLPSFNIFKRFVREDEAIILSLFLQFLPAISFNHVFLGEGLVNPLFVWVIYFLLDNKLEKALILSLILPLIKLSAIGICIFTIIYIIIKYAREIKAIKEKLRIYLWWVFLFVGVGLIISSLYFHINLSKIYLLLYIGSITSIYLLLSTYGGLESEKEDKFKIIKELIIIASIVSVSIMFLRYINNPEAIFYEYGIYFRYVEALFIPMYIYGLTKTLSNKRTLIFIISAFFMANFLCADMTAAPIYAAIYPLSIGLTAVVLIALLIQSTYIKNKFTFWSYILIFSLLFYMSTPNISEKINVYNTLWDNTNCNHIEYPSSIIKEIKGNTSNMRLTEVKEYNSTIYNECYFPIILKNENKTIILQPHSSKNITGTYKVFTWSPLLCDPFKIRVGRVLPVEK